MHKGQGRGLVPIEQAPVRSCEVALPRVRIVDAKQFGEMDHAACEWTAGLICHDKSQRRPRRVRFTPALVHLHRQVGDGFGFLILDRHWRQGHRTPPASASASAASFDFGNPFFLGTFLIFGPQGDLFERGGCRLHINRTGSNSAICLHCFQPIDRHFLRPATS
jgi:hypothetical protein